MDSAVISTNDDATKCKHFAVTKGYWKDNFIEHFVRGQPERKAPEINRGYYARVHSIRALVTRFIEHVGGENSQVVSLGAGFDTMFWWLSENNSAPKGGYYEIDLTPVVQRKCMAIKGRKQLQSAFENSGLKIGADEAHSSIYHLVSADLKDSDEVDGKLVNSGIDKNKPTLFLAECVLVYMEPQATINLLTYITSSFGTVMFVDYDPVNLTDTFGTVMLSNLRGRQCTLLGAHSSLKEKEESYIKCSFDNVTAKLVMDIYSELEADERQRIERLEFLDEVDLLYDLLKHYAVTWASIDNTNSGLDQIKL